VKGVTTGLNAWLLQRVSAVYLLLFIIAIPVLLTLQDVTSYQEWKRFMAHPSLVAAWGLFFISIIGHAWVGIRDVVIDYVHNFKIRMLVMVMLALWLIAMLIWALQVLLISQGGAA